MQLENTHAGNVRGAFGTLTRRQFLKSCAAGAASLALGPAVLSAAAKGGRRPNVLFIAVDDLNDWISCMGGHPDAKTPNIDQLASRGVLFANAHCPAPLCNASRAALLTGVRASTSGVYYNSQPWRQSPALKDAVTLPQHFMAHGYHVVGGGKIFHGRFPDPQSWHEYFPDKLKTKPTDPLPPKRPLNGIKGAGHFDWGPVSVKDEDMGDWKVAEWAAGQLAKKHEKPLFLGVGIFRPHLPWYVPGRYFDMFPADKVTLPNVQKNDLDDVPEIGQRIAKPGGDHKRVVETDNWHKAVAGYLASMAFADVCVGRVLDALDNGPYAKDTIIVFWCDHGWHLGEKLHWRKFTLWEEATRCPMIVVAPQARAGAVCARPANLLDIYPTLIDLCGLRANEACEGLSLLPLLKDPDAGRERPALTTYGRNNHSLRDERWRYIRYHEGSEELYDHSDDEMEWTNLAGETKYDEVKGRFVRWLPKVNAADSPTKSGKPSRKSWLSG
ncbi:MAG: sulfatase [Planctomycetota bacterium]|jgi:arylsulfatase A-like enzyme